MPVLNKKPSIGLAFQVTIPLQSFSNKTKCITNINNCQKPPVHTKSSSSPKSDEQRQNISQTITPGALPLPTTTATTGGKVKDGWSSDDSILKSIDEDNKSTSSTVSSSSAFEDSTNMYSEKSESSMSSINILNNKVKENGKLNNRILDSKTIEKCGGQDDEDDSMEVLSSYDNDSGNDEFDEKGDRFNNFSYSSSDSRSDKKFRNYFNSLPLMRVKKHNGHSQFGSIKRRHFNNSAIDQEPFQDDTKAINLPSPSPSCGSWSSDSNMLQQNLNCTKSSSVPILVKKDQFHEDFNKLTVSDKRLHRQFSFFRGIHIKIFFFL